MAGGNDRGSVRCSQCDRVVKDDDVDRALGVASCLHCHAAFDASDQLDRTMAAKRRQPIDLPRGWTLDTSDGAPEFHYRSSALPALARLDLEWRPGSVPEGLALSGLAVAWLSITIAVAYPSAAETASSGAEVETGLIVVGVVFGIVTLIICTALIHAGVSSLLNRVRVDVSEGRLAILHGPVPGAGPDHVLHADNVEQLYCTFDDGGTYTLHARLSGGETVALLERLGRVHALYVEQLVERALRVDDVSVEGEIGPAHRRYL